MVLELMGKHESDVRVQKHGCSMLGKLAFNDKNRVAIAERARSAAEEPLPGSLPLPNSTIPTKQIQTLLSCHRWIQVTK